MTEKVFEAEISLLPPSVNKMYIYTARGPRPSSEMKLFKTKAALEISRQIRFDIAPPDENKAYHLRIDFFLPSLFNKGWPKKAKTRFKRRDVSNLIKVVEDLVAQGLGIDDSCFTEVSVRKLHGPDHNFTGLRLFITEASHAPQ